MLKGSKTKDTDTTYNLLQKIGNLEFFSTVQTDENGKPILDSKGKTTPKECALTEYINIIFDLFIGICAVLAFVMLVIGGIQYMGSELISSKEAAKSQATNAILGLLVAFSAWLILNTINPKLLDFCLDKNLQTAYLDSLGGEGSGAFIPIDEEKLQALGITKCTGSGGKAAVPEIAKQFIGKTSYSQAKRNTIQGNTIYLDCSSFVAQVYTCAGLPHPGSNTGEMFSGSAQPVDGKTYDFSKLNPGDLIGWKSGNGEKDGHVMIYLGGDQMIDTNGSINTALGSISRYKDRIKYVKWPK